MVSRAAAHAAPAVRNSCSRSGDVGTCPLWNVCEAFAAPGHIHEQIAEMPDEQLYLWTAWAVTCHRASWGEPGKTFAVIAGVSLAQPRTRLVGTAVRP